MAYTVDWVAKVITIPTADLTLVSGTRYSLDMADFLAEVRRLEWEFTDGLWAPTIVDHTNTRFDFAGVNYAPFDDMLNGYTVQITGIATRCDLLGSNNDIIDVLIPTGVSVVPSNSAGLQVVVTGSALLPAEQAQLADIHGQTLREIWVDEEHVAAGDGYQQSPYNTWAAALDYAEANEMHSLVTTTDTTLDRNTKNFVIRGVRFPTIDLNGQDVDKATITAANVTGTHLGQLLLQDCGMNNISGEILGQRVGIAGTYTVRDSAFSLISDVNILSPGLPFIIDMLTGAAGSTVALLRVSGSLQVNNCNHANDVVHLHMLDGCITLDASCTAGNIAISGSASLIDNSAGATVIIEGMADEIIFKRVMENGETFEEQTRLVRADAAGKINQAGDGSYAIRDAANTKDRIVGDDAVNGGRDITSTDGS